MTTDCIACGDDPGYNRAIVHVDSGLEVGELCEQCEEAHFGDLLAHRGHDATCAHCSSSGTFALPRWETETDEDDLIVGDYEIYDDTLRVCSSHFDDINSYGPERNSKHTLVQTRLP
jgi:hypothetical protein